MAKYDKFGREIPDNTPLELPLHFRRPKSLNQVVQEMIRSQLSKEAAERGEESFDEANDFEVDDDDEPYSNHELLDDEEFRSAEQKLLDRAGVDMDNESAVNVDRKSQEQDSGKRRVDRSGRSAEVEEVDGERVEDSESGSSDDGEKRAPSGGERRATGKRGRRV